MLVHRILSSVTCTPEIFIFAKILIHVDCLFEAILGQSYLSLKCSKDPNVLGGNAHWKYKIT